MTRVFTVYNCGTGFNRDRSEEEVVANLASRTVGGRIAFMINDGPGSKPKGPGSQARQPGLHDPITGEKTLASRFAMLNRLRGTATGYGWHHNVAHSVW